jgi:hypothetical protein
MDEKLSELDDFVGQLEEQVSVWSIETKISMVWSISVFG